MEKINIINTINEEIEAGFDFLNSTKIQEEENDRILMASKKFQVNLINDIINSSPNIIDLKIDYSSYDDIKIDENIISFEKQIFLKYRFENKIYEIGVNIDGDNIEFETTGKYFPATRETPPEHPEFSRLNYSSADITFFDEDGEKLNTKWINNNLKLKDTLIRKLIGNNPMN
jgi:hypothetical protein